MHSISTTCGAVLFGLLTLTSCAQTSRPPKLAVVIIVDQMRADLLTRFSDLYTGGFQRMMQNGKVFTRAYHDHAITFTGTGHATVSTGCYPSSHGVIGNGWHDRASNSYSYCCADTAAGIIGYDSLSGRSPMLMKRPGLGDLLKDAVPGARVVSVALKDRSAIFCGGWKPDGVVWFSWKKGKFITSSYYQDTTPAWIVDFNESGYIHQFMDSVWTRMLPDSAYARSREDKFAFEADGKKTEFPHYFELEEDGSAASAYYGDVYGSPFGDRMVLHLALQAMDAYELGKDSVPDLLIVNCSAADWVGHTFGPFSQEVQDHFLRLDLYLEEFFNTLDSTVGQGNYVVALTSDHGALPLPEYLQENGYPAVRLMRDSTNPVLDMLFREVENEFGLDSSIMFKSSNGYCLALDSSVTSDIRIQVEARLAEKIRTLDFVEDVFTRTELTQNIEAGRTYFNIYKNNNYPGRGPDLYVLAKEWIYWTTWEHGTSHGTPYTYDTHVPVLFYGAGVTPGEVRDSVRTIDIAPTMFDLLGLGQMPGCDGVSLRAMLGD